MTTKPVVEIVADVMVDYAEDFSAGDYAYEDQHDAAKELLKALDAAGYIIVPKEPSGEMKLAGMNKIMAYKGPPGAYLFQRAWGIYAAMLAAAAAEDQP